MKKISYDEYWQQSEDDWTYAHRNHCNCHFPCATCIHKLECKTRFDSRTQEQLFNEHGHPIRGKDVITDDHRELKYGVLVGYFKKNGKQYFQNIYGEACDVSMMDLYGHDAIEMEVYGY